MNSGTEEKRLFLGLPLALRFEEAFAGILSGLKQGTEGVRWVEPGQIHVTLHFFGRVPPDRLSEIHECAREVCARNSPLSLGTGGLGFFPEAQNPRVIWLAVTGETDRLVLLQEQLETVLALRGFEVECRPFHAHATLGRIKNPRQFRMRGEQDLRPVSPQHFDALALYQSVLLPQGSRYEILETYPFAKQP